MILGALGALRLDGREALFYMRMPAVHIFVPFAQGLPLALIGFEQTPTL